MRDILVTGAGGFIGHNLCTYLADAGHRVRGVDVHEPWDGAEGLNYAFTRGDFRDRGVMEPLLEGVEVVFHLASAHLQVSLDSSEYWSVNVHSLRPLMETARRKGAQRFVHVSSVGVYGNLRHWPADEEAPCRPQSVYGETKLAGEAVVREVSRETGLPVVIIRPAWVYGPYCPRTLKLYRTLKKGRFVMIGPGDNVRHPIYIADMLESFRLAMEREEAKGRLFVIAGDREVSTNELIEAFCAVMGLGRPKVRIPRGLGLAVAWGAERAFGILGKEPPLSRRTLEFFDNNSAFDISRARRLLGFVPRYSFQEGLRDCKDWLERNVRG